MLDRRVGNIRYRVLGSDPAPWLVMVHGMALDHRDLLAFADTLTDRWRVLVWDMPGHGESQPAPVDYRVPAMADALDTVMTAAGARQAVVLGFSFGGVVAQDFVRRHPGSVSALILYGCFMAYLQPAPVPRWLVGPLVTSMYGIRGWARIKADFVQSCALTEAARAAIAGSPEPLGKRGFLAMTKALLTAGEPDPDFSVTVPLLLISGERDGYARAVAAGFAALAATSPQAETVTVAAAGHCAHLDAPDAFAGAVRSFLDRLPLSGAGPANRPAGH